MDTHVKLLLTDEELQVPAIEELINKVEEWVKISNEGSTKGRKTRSAKRTADNLYEEIMDFKIPPIKIEQPSPIKEIPCRNLSIDSSSDSSSMSKPTRSLRPRVRTPEVTTPTHQRIRTKQPASGGSSVLSAAINNMHPSVSATKIRQLLRADSAQKKRSEEKERQERMLVDMKAKEERAEAQKKQILEERAVTAKLKREQRLLHAAEVRRAREVAKAEQKKKAAQALLQQQQLQQQLLQQQQQELLQQQLLQQQQQQQQQLHQNLQQQHQQNSKHHIQPKAPVTKTNHQTPQKPTPSAQQDTPQIVPAKLNETFKKPTDDINNIEITIQDETTDSIQKEKATVTAIWTRAPHLREALTKQFQKSDEERQREVLELFSYVPLPVQLDKIFSGNKAVNTRYLCRTSSAVWTPPNKGLKRTSSMVMTPNDNNKH